MSLRSFTTKTISEFRGAWLLRDQTRQTAQRASLSYNMRYLPGKVFTRFGFSQLYDLGSGYIRSFYSWIANISGFELSRLLYLEEPGLVKMMDIDNPRIDTLYTNTSVKGLSIVEAGQRLYVGHFDANGAPVQNTKVIGALYFDGDTEVDDAWPDPWTAIPVITDIGPGLVTAGVHRFAYRIETRSGFPGRMAPLNVEDAPISFTVAPGGRQLNFALTVTVPVYAARIHVAMTTADNLDQFYDVAEAVLAYVFPEVPQTIDVTVNIVDEDMVASLASTDVTLNFGYLTQTTGAPQASKITRFGNRLAFVWFNKIFVSDPYTVQTLTDPDNVIQVQGQRDIVTAEDLGTNLIIFGTDFTAWLGGDNNRKPRQWAPPASSSESIGAPGPNCVCKSAGFAFLWVAHTSGLYTYNGSFSPIPISFMFDADWNRVNWTAAAKITMADNADERCLYINLPLDGATECNYRMVIDYSRGKTGGIIDPYGVDYTLDDLNNASIVPSLGLAHNFTTKVRELCIGTTNGKLAHRDTAVRTDLGAGIHSLYETGLVLAVSQISKLLSEFGGMFSDIKGSGQLTITAFGLGRKVTADDDIFPIDLEEDPDGMEESRWNLVSENQSVRLETSGVGDWFELQEITAHYKPKGTTKAA